MGKYKQTIVFEVENLLADNMKTAIEIKLAKLFFDEELPDEEIEKLKKGLRTGKEVFLGLIERFGMDNLDKTQKSINFNRNVMTPRGVHNVINQLRESFNVVAYITDSFATDEKIYWLSTFLDFKPNEIVAEEDFARVRGANYYVSTSIERLTKVKGNKVFFDYLYTEDTSKKTEYKVVHQWEELSNEIDMIFDKNIVLNLRESYKTSMGIRGTDIHKICNESNGFNEEIKKLKTLKEAQIIYTKYSLDEFVQKKVHPMQRMIHTIDQKGNIVGYVPYALAYNGNVENMIILNFDTNTGEIGLIGTSRISSDPYMNLNHMYGVEDEKENIYEIEMEYCSLRIPSTDNYFTIGKKEMIELSLDLTNGNYVDEQGIKKLLKWMKLG